MSFDYDAKALSFKTRKARENNLKKLLYGLKIDLNQFLKTKL